jgi:hypothetical protein
MRIVVVAIGIVLALFGVIWALQGFGVHIGDGFMVGNPTWAVIGPITVLVGVAIAAFGWRRLKP